MFVARLAKSIQFKELLEGNSKLEDWYEYEGAEEKRELRAWCEDNGLEI